MPVTVRNVAREKLEQGQLSLGVGVRMTSQRRTGDQMVAAMDAVGVDGAILASPSACIATTGQLHPNVFAAHPSRFSWSSRPIRPTPPSTVFWPRSVL
jgi:hypothetical protein